MGRYIGDQNLVGFYYESGTYANVSGALQWIGMVQEVNPDESTGIIEVRYQGSNDRNVDQLVNGPLDYTGTFTYYPQDWKFLMFALGSIVDAGSPSPYTHEIKESNSADGNQFTSGTDNPFISFGLEIAQQHTDGHNFIRTVKGAMVNSMTITISQGEVISCDIDYVAKESVFSSGTASSLTPTTTRPFMWSDNQVHLPSGTVLDNVKEVSLTINNNIAPQHYINGSREPSTPVPLNRDYELSLTLDANSEWTKTLYDQYFIGGSEFNMMLVVDASTGSRDAYIIMSGCKIMDMEAPQAVEGVNEQTISIKPKSVNVNVNDAIEKYAPW